jgi:hypothetical protein
MKPLLLVTVLIVAGVAQAQAPSCDKLPYRLGHLIMLNSTDLRDHPRAITKKEWKEMSKKNEQTQADCNAFVRKYPGHPVSTELAFTVKGFAAYLERCDSFCGTEKDLRQLTDKEVDEMMAPHK